MLRVGAPGVLAGVIAGCGGQSQLFPGSSGADLTEADAADAFVDGAGDARAGDTLVPASTAATTDGNTFTGTGCLRGDTACSNCIDDDGDGLLDAFDPECTGPLDDDERTFATGIPGDNRDFCQDCFFDGNSGHGDDGCQYHTDCLYGETPRAAGRSGCFQCEVSDECRSNCLDLTPNGCDCFGCCERPDAGGEPRYARLSETCQLDRADDPAACEICVPSSDCFNACDPCEICIGKLTVDASCDPPSGDPAPACPDDVPACSAQTPCPDGRYCLTGCCLQRFQIR
jgi:hypothetical protein